jgi:hypothetical protein
MEVAELVRRAITAAGGRASSGQIRWQLRKAGHRINQHTVLKTLRQPRFTLTNRGWMNELRQTELF